jgi:hypothetical protein
VESSRPSELLCQDTYVGNFKGVDKVCLHSVVDTHGSYAFGFLSTGCIPEGAVALLHNDALPFSAERGIPVGAILTDNGRESYGIEHYPFELYPALNDVEHRRTRCAAPKPTALSNASMARSGLGSSRSPYVSACTPLRKSSSPILIAGSSTTTPSALTAATATAASARWIPSTAA